MSIDDGRFTLRCDFEGCEASLVMPLDINDGLDMVAGREEQCGDAAKAAGWRMATASRRRCHRELRGSDSRALDLCPTHDIPAEIAARLAPIRKLLSERPDLFGAAESQFRKLKGCVND